MEVCAAVGEGYELRESIGSFWSFDEGRMADLLEILGYSLALRE